MSLTEQFRAILAEHQRVAIVGGPKMGKSTLARLASDRPVIHVVRDGELIDPAANSVFVVAGYEPEAPAKIIAAVRGLESFVIEGVQVARALRGPRVENMRLPGLLVDAVIYLRQPKVLLSEMLPGHLGMAVGTRTIFEKWRRSGSSLPPIYEEPQAIPRT